MASQRQFEPATERRAMQRRNDGFRRLFNRGQHLRQMRCLQGQVKFLDIGPGDECPALARNDDHLDGAVGQRLLQPFEQLLPNPKRQGIDRWIVDDDLADITFTLEHYSGVHRLPPVEWLGLQKRKWVADDHAHIVSVPGEVRSIGSAAHPHAHAFHRTALHHVLQLDVEFAFAVGISTRHVGPTAAQVTRHEAQARYADAGEVEVITCLPGAFVLLGKVAHLDEVHQVRVGAGHVGNAESPDIFW